MPLWRRTPGTHAGWVDIVTVAATPVVAYLLVMILVALDAVIPALPGEVAVISGGALSAAAHLGIGWVVAAAAVGAFAGDLTVYMVGRHRLPGVLGRTRPGRRITAGVKRANLRLGESRAAAIIAARFIPFGRTATAGAAGLAGVPARRFAAFSLIGAVTWSAWMSGVGYVTGNVTDGPLPLQIAIGVGVGLLVGVWATAIHRVILIRRRMSARAVASTAGTGDVETSEPDRDADCLPV